MKITKKLYWTSLNYFDTEKKTMYGDMLDYCEERDGRTDDLEEIKEGISYDAQDYFYAELGNDTIPVRTLYSSEFTDEVDDEDEFSSWYASEDEGTRTAVGIYVYTSEERARATGLLDHLTGEQEGTPITFMY